MIAHMCLPCGSGVVDLEDLARSTGLRVKNKYTGEVMTSVGAKQCRKLLRLVLRYADGHDLKDADEYLRRCGNKKVMEIWEDECERARF
ncbi:MAG: hypothetical protein IKO83_11160 [Oscillospiraceae bacterium]|nr:hypothetical protein [Oscillospiraceae bacterium]